jgi:hypothetical protein
MLKPGRKVDRNAICIMRRIEIARIWDLVQNAASCKKCNHVRREGGHRAIYSSSELEMYDVRREYLQVHEILENSSMHSFWGFLAIRKLVI